MRLESLEVEIAESSQGWEIAHEVEMMSSGVVGEMVRDGIVCFVPSLAVLLVKREPQLDDVGRLLRLPRRISGDGGLQTPADGVLQAAVKTCWDDARTNGYAGENEVICRQGARWDSRRREDERLVVTYSAMGKAGRERRRGAGA